MHYSQGHLQPALIANQRALELARQIGNQEIETGVLQNIGLIYTNMGNYDEAEEALSNGLQIARKMGHRDRISDLLLNRGDLYGIQERYVEARQDFEESLQNSRQLKHHENICYLLLQLTIIDLEEGKVDIALKNLQESEKLAEKLNIPVLISGTALRYGDYHLYQKKWAEAKAAYQRSLDRAISIGYEEFVAEAKFGWAQSALPLNQREEAFLAVVESLGLFRQMGHEVGVAKAENWLRANGFELPPPPA